MAHRSTQKQKMKPPAVLLTSINKRRGIQWNTVTGHVGTL